MAKKLILSKEQLNEINDCYINKLWSSEQICNYFGFSATYFKRLIKDNLVQRKTEEQRQKTMRKTTEQRYGDSNYRNVDQAKKTCLEKYGDENYRNSEQISASLKERYSNPKKKLEFQTKIRQTKLERYGDENFNNRELYKKTLKEKYTNENYFIKNIERCIEAPFETSQYENDIKNYLITECGILENEIIIHDKVIISPLRVGIYMPKYNFGIDFNNNYWHCDEHHRFQDQGGRSLWHQKKSLLAEEKEIFLFHIFEYERNSPLEQQNIKSRLKTLLLKNCRRIPARKCSLIELTKEQKKNFLNTNHIQGNDHSTKHYGLLFQNEIVACMTFVKPKNKKYTWELSRFCVKNNYVVQGGASKLFTHFTKSLNKGDTVSSYNDITKTKGELYKILGFKCVSINNPNYIWMNFSTNDIRTRYQEQEAGEVERMHSLGYHRICDCGTRTWVYTVE